jgi:hypothetical protein
MPLRQLPALYYNDHHAEQAIDSELRVGSASDHEEAFVYHTRKAGRLQIMMVGTNLWRQPGSVAGAYRDREVRHILGLFGANTLEGEK